MTSPASVARQTDPGDSIPSHAGCGQDHSWKRHVDAGMLFLLAYVAFFLASKLIGFTTGYALDDYGIIRQGGNESLAAFFISQGRYASALMDVVVHASHLTMSSFSTIGLAATTVFSGLFFKDALDLPKKGSASVAIGLGALLGAHPYYTEYVSFRQSALPMSMMFLGMWYALRLYRTALANHPVRLLPLIGSILVGTLVMGFNQLTTSFLAIAVLCVHLRRQQRHAPLMLGAEILRRAAWISPIYHAALAGAVLIVGNMLVAKLCIVVFDTPALQRTQLVATGMLAERATDVMRLLPLLWARSETIVAWPSKVIALTAFVLLLAAVLPRNPRLAGIALATFIVATAAALIPTAASASWWPVPRTLIAVPFALAAAIAMVIPVDSRRTSLAGILLIVSACIFAAHSTTVLSNQQRLNRWDQMQARDITQLANEKYPDTSGKLAIVGPSWAHDIAQSIAQGDLNISALSVDWALDPLFDEATGRDQTVRLAPEFSELCSTSPKYPNSASLHREGDEVVVCMH